ncbi:hypothetical protein C9374_014006 [Naegleria lovaniensis]|uniref:CCDC93 coiled-coil domain-containing protein n=1 Tax=Naegleria lovaniensis TaxID=51637 RepID=A0AA88GW05_NAELO|nr:uncharacterized protein C9374_014006 [Naegleria lovaniensis]KAG2389446.1 hypothetical protein C9374_014006 [Naegleria lovaniensis]
MFGTHLRTGSAGTPSTPRQGSSSFHQQLVKTPSDQQQTSSSDSSTTTNAVPTTNLEGINEKNLNDYQQILQILLAAGYFRVRISALTPFDKILGGLCWCISNSYNADADVEMLSYEEEANIGKKIKLSEKVVLALRRMGCPQELSPVQIQGLDCPFILKVFSWLVQKVFESRVENKERIQRYSELQFSRRYELPQDQQDMEQYNQALPYLDSIRGVYHPKRKFKHQQRNVLKSEWGHVQTVLLEYGIEFKKIERSQQEKEDKSKLERQLRAQKQASRTESMDASQLNNQNLAELDLDEEAREKKIQELKKLVEQNENFYNNISASGASNLINLGAVDIIKLKEEYDEKTRDFMGQQENLQSEQMLHKRQVAQLTKQIENQKVIYMKAKEEFNAVKQEYEKVSETLSKFKEYNEQVQNKITELQNQVQNQDVDQAILSKLETLIALNEAFKKQEADFKTNCQLQLQELKNSIAQLESSFNDSNDPIVQLSQAYANDTEKMKKIRKLAAKRNRELAIVQSKIDEIPSRTELSQYERRFTELYAQISTKLDETKKYFVSYNTLSGTCTFLEQELSLLNSIADFFQKAVQSQDKKYKAWMINTVSDRAEKVKQTKTQMDTKLKETEKKRDDLQNKYNELVSKQRNYFRAVKEFQNEMLKNDELNKRLKMMQ